MATSKSVQDETNSSASPDTEIDGKTLCSPCHFDGYRFEAVGYCKDCKEYLCETCFKVHRRPTITRKHVLLDREQMVLVEGSDNHCPEHEKRAVEYNCPTHSFFGCSACFFEHQKTCKDSRYIPNVAENLLSSEEFKVFTTKLDYVATKIKGLIAKAERNSESVNKRIAENITAIKAFKLQVIEAVERLEKNLINKAKHLGETDTTKWEAILEKCITFQETSTAMSTEKEVLQNKHQNADLYLAMIKSSDKLMWLEDQMNAIDKDSDVKLTTYEGNSELLETLKSPCALGKLVDSGSISSAEHVTDINVKTGDDDSTCCIRGSVMMPEGKLVICDENNKKVKLVDARKNKVVSEMKMSNNPWSVAKVTDTTVVVTVPEDKKIVFVRMNPVLSTDRELVVKQSCHGVAYCEGKLVVTNYGEDKVAVLDLQGTVLREIATDDDGKALLNGPYTVATDPNNNVMYVSNVSGECNVKCLTLVGTVVATYKDSELKHPQQSVVDSNGMVFVCGYWSSNVHLMTSDCKKVKVLLTNTDGVVSPETISYDENRRRLYVGVGNSLKVYRVKYSPAL